MRARVAAIARKGDTRTRTSDWRANGVTGSGSARRCQCRNIGSAARPCLRASGLVIALARVVVATTLAVVTRSRLCLGLGLGLTNGRPLQIVCG